MSAAKALDTQPCASSRIVVTVKMAAFKRLLESCIVISHGGVIVLEAVVVERGAERVVRVKIGMHNAGGGGDGGGGGATARLQVKLVRLHKLQDGGAAAATAAAATAAAPPESQMVWEGAGAAAEATLDTAWAGWAAEVQARAARVRRCVCLRCGSCCLGRCAGGTRTAHGASGRRGRRWRCRRCWGCCWG